MEADAAALFLARIQFAFTISFHFIFPSFSIGLASYLAVAGIFSIALGVVIVMVMLINPLASILTVAWVIGIYALAAGVVLIIQAFRLRKG